MTPVHRTGRDLELCDVDQPFLIGRCGLEVSVDEVLRRWTYLTKGGRVSATLGLGDDQAFLLQQTLHHLLREGDALHDQRSLQTAVAAAAMIRLKDVGDRLQAVQQKCSLCF